MLLTGEHHRQVLLVLAPSHDVHHRLSLVILAGQCFVEAGEQLFTSLAGMATDDQGRTRIVVDNGYIVVVREFHNGCQLPRQALPRVHQWQYTRDTSLQMGMVGS